MSQFDWGSIQAAAAILGIREAARRAAINFPPDQQTAIIERIRKRASRGQWVVKLETLGTEPNTTIDADTGKIVQNAMSPRVPTGAEIVKSSLDDERDKTRQSLSKAAMNMAKEAETAGLPAARHAHEVAKMWAVTHGIGQGNKDGASLNPLSTLNIGIVINQADQE